MLSLINILSLISNKMLSLINILSLISNEMLSLIKYYHGYVYHMISLIISSTMDPWFLISPIVVLLYTFDHNQGLGNKNNNEYW
jgi:hypothetical protein